MPTNSGSPVSHTSATRAALRLQYRPDRVVLTISDDGAGEPAVLMPVPVTEGAPALR